jgi:hypothetical protein
MDQLCRDFSPPYLTAVGFAAFVYEKASQKFGLARCSIVFYIRGVDM